MKTKKYLVKIDSTHGATVHIGINSDNAKPIFVYYCGRDTGRRYVNIGSAARVWYILGGPGPGPAAPPFCTVLRLLQ